VLVGLEQRPLAALIPYAQNARTHSDEQIEEIAASIKEFGWTNPVLIDEEGGIIAGHGRVKAAERLLMTEAPVLILAGLSAAQKRAYAIADNKIPLNAGWDEKLLAMELLDLKAAGYQLDLTGFSAFELRGLIGEDAPTRSGKTADDTSPEPPDRPVTHVGDVWVLGRHRLMVGDATALADVQRLMGEGEAHLVWTDPPYNVAYQADAGTILNDDQAAADFDRFLLRAFQATHWAMRPGAVIYVAHADSERWAFTEAFERAGFKMAQVLVWVKQSGVLSRQDYNWQHEPILYGWKEGAGHYFAGDYTQTTVIDDDVNVDKLLATECRALLKKYIAAQRSTVLREPRPSRSELHPTMKPVALVERMMLASSQETDLVFDPFGGSGTTLITAEKTNRRCRIMELDPKYADVIIERWQDYTGKTAKHISGLTFAEAAKNTPTHEDA